MGEVSFYSIDRLVEFGLSMAVATQMANSMNEMLNRMQTPGAGRALQPMPGALRPSTGESTTAYGVTQPLGPSIQAVYYAALDGTACGPYSAVELARLIAERRVTKETYIWKPGTPSWQLAEALPEVLALAALTPPPVPK